MPVPAVTATPVPVPTVIATPQSDEVPLVEDPTVEKLRSQ